MRREKSREKEWSCLDKLESILVYNFGIKHRKNAQLVYKRKPLLL